MKFEEILKRLDDISNSLENGDVGLDECVKMYEEAGELLKAGQEQIAKGKGKIIEINEKLEEVEFADNK